MKTLFKYGAVASVFLLTAGPAALAQNYNPNYGPGWNQGGSNQSSPAWHQGGFSGGGQGWNQGGFSGSSQGPSNMPSAQEAYQQLNKFGYNNIQGMERSRGWEARATKDGDRVHVFVDDDGMVATYRGN